MFMTIFIEFPWTTAEILKVIKRAAYLQYLDVSDTVDYYVEQLVRLEVLRRKYCIDELTVRELFADIIRRYPIVESESPNSYCINHVIEVELLNSVSLWARLEEEVVVLPNEGFLLFHTGSGVWRMFTTGGVAYGA
ncbi:hypothetical protein SH780_000149 [Shigella flexneri]|jgi:hypothetical protein|nr:hypothetical protein [Shigella flexneri]DAY66704.1 MAG TPA: hypothetical protein [Caudoviricetes sp.]